MIAIGDARRRFGFPWVTSLLLLLSVALFLYEHAAPQLSEALITAYGFNPNTIAERSSLTPLWTTLTCLLLQGTGWLEPIVNIVYFWVLGRKVEDACGPWGFLFLCLFSGAGGVISALMLHPLHPQGDQPVYGLAGVIAGLFGAYLILYRAAPIRAWVPLALLWRPWVPAALHLLYWAGLVFVNVDISALLAGRILQTVSLEATWPFLGALLVGLLAGRLLTRQEFLYYHILRAHTPAR